MSILNILQWNAFSWRVYSILFGISEVPSSYSIGNNLADDQSAFWKFRKLQTLVFTDFKHNQSLVRNAYDQLQQKIAQQQVKMEKKYNETHDVKIDPTIY